MAARSMQKRPPISGTLGAPRNGEEPPPQYLHRLEIRICDLITGPLVLLRSGLHRVAAVLQLDSNPRPMTPPAQRSAIRAGANYLTQRLAAARASLDANCSTGQRRSRLPARTWLRRELEPSMQPLAIQLGLGPWPAPLARCWHGGHERAHDGVANEAMRWLGLTNGGKHRSRS